MTIPEELKYTPSHEWVRIENDVATVGITDHAQDELGDITYLELPEVGRVLAEGEMFGVVESVKAVSDLYSPVAGEVIEVNQAITGATETVNRDPYGEGWMVKIRLADPDQLPDLLTAAGYAAHLEESGH